MKLNRLTTLKTKFNLLAGFLLLISPHPSIAQWQTTSGPTGAGHISSIAVNGSTLFAGTLTGGVFISSNNGNTWTASNNGLSNMNNVISLTVDGNNIFAGIGNSLSDTAVFLSTNNGVSWSAKNLAFNFLWTIAVKPGYVIAGTWDGVSYSTNNGTSWMGSATGLPSNSSVGALAFSGTKIFAGVISSSVGGTGVFSSVNNMASWNAFNTGLTSTVVNSLAVIGSNVFAGTASGGVFISSTSSSGWSTANAGLTNNSIRTLYVLGNNLFVGTDAGIFLTTNSGANWIDISAGLPANSKIYSIAADNVYLYAGTDSIVWRKALAELSLAGIEETNLQNTIEVYPNPFTTQTIISFKEEQKHTVVMIVDMFGKKIKTINFTGQQLTIEKGEMSSGIYFVQIIDEKKNIVNRKIIIQ